MFAVKDDEIQYLVDKECDNAMKYGKFNSDHEFYAVLKEEFEESQQELDKVKYYIDKMWKDIKCNILDSEDLERLKMYSTYTIKELLQVSAVCDKQLNNMKGE